MLTTIDTAVSLFQFYKSNVICLNVTSSLAPNSEHTIRAWHKVDFQVDAIRMRASSLKEYFFPGAYALLEENVKWPQWTLWFWNDSWIAQRDKSTSNWWNKGKAGWEVVKIKISNWSLESWNGLEKNRWSSYLEARTSISEFNVNVLLFFTIRFLGSTKIPLRDLSTGHARSLPSRNVPLVNESGQNIGVGSADMSIQKAHLPRWNDMNNRARYSSLPGYHRPYDWLRSSSQRHTKPQWPRCRRFHSWRWYVDVLHKQASAVQ